MKEQRARNRTAEETCAVKNNDLADSQLRFRNMDLPQGTEYDKRLCERLCYRMLCILWTGHDTNDDAFNSPKLIAYDRLLQRRLAYHGHLVRKPTLHLTW